MVKHACTAAYSVCVVFYAVNGLIIQTLAMMLDKMEGEKYFQQKSKKKKKKCKCLLDISHVMAVILDLMWYLAVQIVYLTKQFSTVLEFWKSSDLNKKLLPVHWFSY